MANNGRFDESGHQQPEMSTAVVQNLQNLVNGFNQGSTEVKNLLRFECNVIVECRICRNMFRSFPSFLTHKRIYCKDSAFERVEPTFVNVKELTDAIRPTSTESCPTITTTTTTTDIGDDENKLQNNHLNKVPIVKTYAKSSPIVVFDNRNGDVSSSSRNASKFSLNILNRLVKRNDLLSADDENLPSSPSIRYTNINRVVLPTRIENGFHIVNNRTDINKLLNLERKDAESSSTVTMVVPQDAAHRQHTMALRTRRNFNPATTVKEIDADDAKIYEHLERSALFDVSTLMCLIEKCGKTFKTAKSAMFHSLYDHLDLELKRKCYFCSEDDVLYDGRTLNSHLEQHGEFLRYKEEFHFGSSRQNAISKTIEDKIVEIASKISESTQKPFTLNSVGDDSNLDEKYATDETKKSDPENEFQHRKIVPVKQQVEESDEDEEEEDIKPKRNSKSPNSEHDLTSPPKTTWQQRELAKLSSSSNLRIKRERKLKSPYDSTEFVSSLPKRLKRSPFEYSPTDGRMIRRKIGGGSDSPKLMKFDVSTASSPINFDKLPIIFSEKHKEESLAIMNLKLLKCLKCGAAFTNKCNLERHCYMHFGFVRFRCSKCDVGAFFRTELRRHLRFSCPNLKRNEANLLNEEKLNSLINAACPEQPGKVTIWKKCPTVWGSNFKGRQKIHYRPSLRKKPTKQPSSPESVDDDDISSYTPIKVSSDEDLKLSELKSGEKISMISTKADDSEPTQLKNAKSAERKDARLEKKSPKKTPPAVSPVRNRRKENPPKKLIVPTAGKLVIPAKSATSATNKIAAAKTPTPAVKSPIAAASLSPEKNIKLKKDDKTTKDVNVCLDFGKRLQNPMKQYQGSFKKLNMLLAQRRAANEKKSKRIQRLKPSPTKAPVVVNMNSSSSDSSDVEIKNVQNLHNSASSEQKREVVKMEKSQDILILRQEKLPISMPVRSIIVDKPAQETQKVSSPGSSIEAKKMLKPVVKMIAGPDGKVYFKPYVPINAAKK